MAISPSWTPPSCRSRAALREPTCVRCPIHHGVQVPPKPTDSPGLSRFRQCCRYGTRQGSSTWAKSHHCAYSHWAAEPLEGDFAQVVELGEGFDRRGDTRTDEDLA